MLEPDLTSSACFLPASFIFLQLHAGIISASLILLSSDFAPIRLRTDLFFIQQPEDTLHGCNGRLKRIDHIGRFRQWL